MQSYESLLNETSTAQVPWFAIPADDKSYMRLSVAQIILDTLSALPLRYPEKNAAEIKLFEEHIAHLNGDDN